MAHVVELFGAPGTGKSSLARALDGRDVAGRRIVAAERLTRVPRAGMLGRLRDRDLTPAERRAALAARADDWSELLALAAAAPAALADDPLRALHATGWLTATLELRALADAAPDDVIVVLDEGLVQRTAVVCGPAPDDATLDRYLGALPTTLLHLRATAGAEVLLQRLGGRERTIDRHVGLDEAVLRASLAADVALADRCARTLEGLGAPVAAVPTDTTDTGDSRSAAADEALERIRSMLP